MGWRQTSSRETRQALRRQELEAEEERKKILDDGFKKDANERRRMVRVVYIDLGL
jgi:hypothetical protein